MYLVRSIGDATAPDIPGNNVQWTPGQTRYVHESLIQSYRNNPAAWEIVATPDASPVTSSRNPLTGRISLLAGSDFAIYAAPPSGDVTGALDDVAIARAIALAGASGTVRLSPGVYYTKNGVTLLSNQVFDLGGATIKRAAQITTTTATSLISGSTTTFTVADASGFLVGDKVVCVNGTQYSAAAYIQSIVGNVITLTAALQVGSTSILDESRVIVGPADTSWTLAGATVYKTYYTVLARGAREVKNGVIDGSRSTWANGKWDTCTELQISDTQVDNIEIKDFPGEGMQQSGAEGDFVTAMYPGATKGNPITRCHIHDGNGNGIHLSGTRCQYISGNRFYNLNADLTVGHVGGAVAFSWGGYDVKIVNNHIERCYSAISPIAIDSESRVMFAGNTVSDMQRYGVEAYVSSEPYSTEFIQITGNKFINCGALKIGSHGSVSQRLHGSIVSNNILLGTGIEIWYADDMLVSGNMLDNRYNYVPTTTTSAVTGGTSTSFTVTSATGLSAGKQIVLGKSGVVSETLVIASVASLTVTVTSTIAASFATGASVYRIDQRKNAMVSVGTTIGDTQITLADASLFYQNQWVVVFDATSGSATTGRRIKSIDHGTNVLTIDGSLDRTLASGAIRCSPGGSLDVTGIYVDTSAPIVSGNIIAGGGSGIGMNNACSGTLVVNNKVSEYRKYGIASSATAASTELIQGNYILPLSAWTASWSWAIWQRGQATVRGNECVTSATQTDTAIKISGNNGIIDANVIRAAAGAAITAAVGTTGNKIYGNYVNQAVTDSGTNTVSGSVTIT